MSFCLYESFKLRAEESSRQSGVGVAALKWLTMASDGNGDGTFALRVCTMFPFQLTSVAKLLELNNDTADLLRT